MMLLHHRVLALTGQTPRTNPTARCCTWLGRRSKNNNKERGFMKWKRRNTRGAFIAPHDTGPYWYLFSFLHPYLCKLCRVIKGDACGCSSLRRMTLQGTNGVRKVCAFTLTTATGTARRLHSKCH